MIGHRHRHNIAGFEEALFWNGWVLLFLCVLNEVQNQFTGFFESERGFSENPAFRLLYGIFRRKNPVLACFWYVFRWKNPVCVVFALSRRSFLLVCALFHTPFLTQPISPLTIPLRKRKRSGDRKEGRGKREILSLKAPRDSSIVTTFSVYWKPFQYSDPAIQYTDPKSPYKSQKSGVWLKGQERGASILTQQAPYHPRKESWRKRGGKKETSILTQPKSFLFSSGEEGSNPGWEKKCKKNEKSKSGEKKAASI